MSHRGEFQCSEVTVAPVRKDRSKTVSSKVTTKNTTLRPDPSRLPGHDEVAALAYALFLRNGAQHGHDLDHWLAAERELLSRVDPRPSAEIGHTSL